MFNKINLKNLNIITLPLQVWIIYFLVFFLEVSYYFCIPYLPFYWLQEKNFSPIAVGILMSFEFLSCMLFGFLGGILLDKYGIKKVLCISYFFLAFNYFAFLFTNRFLGFLIMRVFHGMLDSTQKPSIKKFLSASVQKSEKQLAFGMRLIFKNLGMACGPLMVLFFKNWNLKFRFTMAGFTCILFGMAILCFYQQKSVPTNIYQSKSEINVIQSLRIVIKNKFFVYLLISYIFIIMGHSNLKSAVPQYLGTILKNKEESHSLFSVMLFFNGMVTNLFLFVISLFLKCKSINAMFFSNMIISVSLILIPVSTNLVYLSVIALLFGISKSIATLTVDITIDSLSNFKFKGAFWGIASSIGQFGNVIGPIISGTLFSLLPSNCVVFTFPILAIFSTAGLLPILAIKEYYLS